MNQKKVTDAILNIKTSYIEEAVHYRKASGKNTWLKWGSVAASFVLVAVVAVVVWQSGIFTKDPEEMSGDKVWPEKPTSSKHETSKPEDAGVLLKPWDELSISEQFWWFSMDGKEFYSKVTEIAASQVGAFLGKATLQGFDQINNTEHTTVGQVFAINGIKNECGVAVRLEGREDYFVYVNSYYKPNTLGDLINDLNLTETMSFGSVYYGFFRENSDYVTVEFVDLADSVVWEMLLSDRTLQNVENYDSMMLVDSMSISVNIPLLGYQNISLGVTDDGYLTTNILDTGKAFFIGEEKVQQFKDYVIENCEGYELVYDHGDTAPQPEAGYEGESLPYATPAIAYAD